MPASKRKGATPARVTPERSERTASPTRVGRDPRRDQRRALKRELQRLAGRHHPDDARRVWLAARVEHTPEQWRADALDLAVAVRQLDGTRRLVALAEVGAAVEALDRDGLTDWATMADLGAMALLDAYAPDPLPARVLPAPAAVFIGVLQ